MGFLRHFWARNGHYPQAESGARGSAPPNSVHDSLGAGLAAPAGGAGRRRDAGLDARTPKNIKIKNVADL